MWYWYAKKNMHSVGGGGVVGLVHYCARGGSRNFEGRSCRVTESFSRSKSRRLTRCVVSLLSGMGAFIPRVRKRRSAFFREVRTGRSVLLLPSSVVRSLLKIMGTVTRQVNVRGFLFRKTPNAKGARTIGRLTHVLRQRVCVISFSAMISDGLNRARGGLTALFARVGDFPRPSHVVVLFSRVSTVTLSQASPGSLHRVKETASTVLGNLSHVGRGVMLVTAAGLCGRFSGTLVEEFSSVVGFGRCDGRSLVSVTRGVLSHCLDGLGLTGQSIHLFQGVVNLVGPLPCPKSLGGLVHDSVTFDSPRSKRSCFHELCSTTCNGGPRGLRVLRTRGFAMHRVRVLAGGSGDDITQRLGNKLLGRWCASAREPF